MKYIVHRRFKDTAICGEVNLPAMTECESTDGILMYNGKPICLTKSSNAHQFFAINEDGNGMLRGKLTQAIHKTLEKRKGINDAEYQARWDKVWNDGLCSKYKRTDHEDFWLFNHDFYNAPIFDLQYIADLVGVPKKEVEA